MKGTCFRDIRTVCGVFSLFQYFVQLLVNARFSELNPCLVRTKFVLLQLLVSIQACLFVSFFFGVEGRGCGEGEKTPSSIAFLSIQNVVIHCSHH